MANAKYTLKPQDILILLKIIALGDIPWYHHTLAEDLGISQSEVSLSLTRSCYAGLIDHTRKNVNKLALMEFLSGGISYVFPQQPGTIVRGVPTGHSARPLSNFITSNIPFVWPYAKGAVQGMAIEPLYPAAVKASLQDEKLYELLALVDGIRVGKAREKEIAKKELEQRIFHVQ